MEIANYLTLIGVSQGHIQGECDHSAHAKKIEILSFEHNVGMPMDVGKSLNGGKITHSPIVASKRIDCATPKMYQALFRNERLEKVEFEWFHHRAGKLSKYFSISLQNALIVRIQPKAESLLSNEGQNHPFIESFSLVYDYITWSYGESGEIVFTQNWLARE